MDCLYQGFYRTFGISGDEELIKLSHFIWPSWVGESLKCGSMVMYFPERTQRLCSLLAVMMELTANVGCGKREGIVVN